MENEKRIKVALQMFNLVAGGDWSEVHAFADLEHLLRELAAAGYDGVEWCNFQFENKDLELPAVKTLMDELELQTCGYHFHYTSPKAHDAPPLPAGEHPASLQELCQTAVNRCHLLGCDKIIFAYSMPSTFGMDPDENGVYTPAQIDAWVREADLVLAALKEAAHPAGIQVLYHNHNAELLTGTDGSCFLDNIHADALETDVYWIAKGLDGKASSALDFIRQRRSLVQLFHMKDGLNGSLVTNEMCGWGKGTYPLQEILNCAKELDLSWVVLENDAPKNFGTSGLQDAMESAVYFKTHLDLLF